MKAFSAAAATWSHAVELSRARLDFVQTNALDRALQAAFPARPDLDNLPIRLAVLGSSTVHHLHAGIRVAGLRHGLWIETYEPGYGQYLQEISDQSSGLHRFSPTAVLFALDAHHLSAGVDAGMDGHEVEKVVSATIDRLAACWRQVREEFGCAVLQHSLIPTVSPVLGANEHRLPGSAWSVVRDLNSRLRAAADIQGVDLVPLDDQAVLDGREAWCDPTLWYRARQEINPAAVPVYGELVVRLLAARRGLSRKCLVLDLDNTLWGGVVGDDGLNGIVLGQGSAEGEAFAAVQTYARELSRRGIVLAVCSKNDERVALEAFEHADMVLRRDDISVFMANWNDKAANLREIASRLKFGLDALVLLDDSAFERELVRRELPMVAVPELPDDPTGVPERLARAGYFEAVTVTDEDRARAGLYRSNQVRESARSSATDLAGYLSDLRMRLLWCRFNMASLPRLVQLINKTNQFNLTTRRYAEEDIASIMRDPVVVGLQFRLIDRFGDNGLVVIVIGRLQDDDVLIDTWLMSCRVLGRQVEAATLNVLAEVAARSGARRLVGEYRPTSRNGIVQGHYASLGFATIGSGDDGDTERSVLDLAAFTAIETPIDIEELSGG